MTPLIDPGLQRYADAHSQAEPPLLRRLRQETERTMADPQMLCGPHEGALLNMLVTLTRARSVLEVGTFTGYSALWMAAALPARGRLVTCEANPAHAEFAHRYFKRSPHDDKIELRFGPAIETIRELARKRRRFDFVFLDADKTGYADYYEAAVPMLRPGGLIAADNVLWSGRVLRPHDADGRAMAAYNRRVRRDRRVECVLLTDRDGIMLARKK